MKYIQALLVALLSCGAFADSCTKYNDPATGLNLAIRELIEQKQSSRANKLLASGFPANSANACGATLLQIASIMNDVDLAKTLISKNANPNAKNHLGQTPVFLAANWSSNEILKILLENGGDPNTKVDEASLYNTALIIAAVNRNYEGVRLLIKFGAKPEYKNQKGISALTIAATKNDQKLSKALSTSQP